MAAALLDFLAGCVGVFGVVALVGLIALVLIAATAEQADQDAWRDRDSAEPPKCKRGKRSKP